MLIRNAEPGQWVHHEVLGAMQVVRHGSAATYVRTQKSWPGTTRDAQQDLEVSLMPAPVEVQVGDCIPGGMFASRGELWEAIRTYFISDPEDPTAITQVVWSSVKCRYGGYVSEFRLTDVVELPLTY